MKNISILGSTGSIGTSTLQVVNHLNGLQSEPKVKVVGIAAGENIEKLFDQILEFKPKYVAVFNKEKALKLQKRLQSITLDFEIDVLSGEDGVCQIASLDEVSLVVSAIVGFSGVKPTIEAIKAKKDVALSNKEVLIAAGNIVMGLAKENGVNIIPVDSEHHAIFECLKGRDIKDVKKIILTASGGPFRNKSLQELKEVTLSEALNHPNWSMGNKVTIDSSTLMNKGLEVIEAYYLFNIPIEQIEVVVHPQSIVHSMIELVDGSMIAQLNEPTMLIPIQHALTYPERKKGIVPDFDFTKFSRLDFQSPDLNKFPCLALAYEAIKVGGSLPCFMNAVNEVLVTRFLHGQIGWNDISYKLEKLMGSHSIYKSESLDDLITIDSEARKEAQTA